VGVGTPALPFLGGVGAPWAINIYFHLAGHASLVANIRTRMAKTDITNPIDRHVGSRLRMRRLASGMSQQSLGKKIGVTFQQVQKYEKGMNRIGASRLQQAANVLAVSVPFFFEGGATGGPYMPDGSAPSPTYIDDFASSSDGLKLAKAFTRLARSTVRHRIVTLVQEIADRQS
jgi:transcriptional regulator with XRE-family HTH domain